MENISPEEEKNGTEEVEQSTEGTADTPNNQSRKDLLSTPFAIIITGALVAGAIIYTNGVGNPKTAQVRDVGVVQNGPRDVTAEDHIFGSIDAPVKIIEFSDTECPFCKRFHSTMLEIMNEYGSTGRVAWVYRHFPLDSLHSKARKEAEATECAAKLGGNNGFWLYLGRLFEVTPSNDGLDLAELPKIATHVGLNQSDFEKCLESGEMKERVERDYQDAVASGGQGTPHTIVVTQAGKKFPINGAQPYDAVKETIEKALAE